MWVVTEYGFYNIVCQDGDKKLKLLTFKARDKRDIQNLIKLLNLGELEIEESDMADYRFRIKVPIVSAVRVIADMVYGIDYPKTKPKITERFPERMREYLQVWEDLLSIQERYEQKTKAY